MVSTKVPVNVLGLQVQSQFQIFWGMPANSYDFVEVMSSFKLQLPLFNIGENLLLHISIFPLQNTP